MNPSMIAIVPTEEWREALLGSDTDLESHPPRLLEVAGDGDWRAAGPVCQEYGFDVAAMRQALPLLWAGQPRPDAIARAVRATWNERSPEAHQVLAECCVQLGSNRWTEALLFDLAYVMVEHGIAAEVVISE